MGTQLTDKGDFVEVATVAGPGKRRKLPRTPVLVSKDDPAGIKLEIIRQAKLVRLELGVQQKETEPVV